MKTTVKKLVINASPLICLFGAGLEFILQQVAGEVLVPEVVWDEIMAGPESDRASAMICDIPWLAKIEVSETDPRVADWGLGMGETQVLIKTLHTPGTLAVIDDAQARRCAKTLDIDFIGTGGLLIVAKKPG